MAHSAEFATSLRVIGVAVFLLLPSTQKGGSIMTIQDLTSSPLRESRRLLRIAQHRALRWFRPSIAVARHRPDAQRRGRTTRAARRVLQTAPRAI
jgi:hypothetical protein